MLNISKNIYVGWDSASVTKYPLPEAEILPIGNTTNERKKLSKISNINNVSHEYENVPLPGFTLYRVGKKNWGSVNETWQVMDPRGFLARISSLNLENILHVSGITEGLIQERCVWARENTETKMILVPVSSSAYIDAITNTELFESKVDMKDVQIGDTVLMQNKATGIYMGTVSLYGPVVESYNRLTLELRAQTALRRQVIKIKDKRYFYQTDAKILKVIKQAETAITLKESIEEMNNAIASGLSYFGNSVTGLGQYFGSHGVTRFVSASATNDVKMTFEEISEYDASSLFYDALNNSDVGKIVLENSAGARFLVDYPYVPNLHGSSCSISNFYTCEIDLPTLDETTIIKSKSRLNRYSSHMNRPKSEKLDKFKKFYKIVKHVKNNTYI